MAGELITGPHQVELRGYLFGDGVNSEITTPGIEGLLVPLPKTQDSPYAHRPGSKAGLDLMGDRIVTVPLLVMGHYVSSAIAAWTTSMSDLRLDINVPPFGHIYMYGRPRGLIEGVIDHETGDQTMIATFVANDPTIYSAEGGEP